MKLSAIILVLGCLFGSLQGEAQLVTLSVKNAKLESVLRQIKNQTGYTFFFNELFYSKGSKVTLNLQGATLTETLDACFSQQPALKYTIVGRTVVVAEKEKPKQEPVMAGNNSAVTATTQGLVITGYVYNKRFEALGNASVLVKGANRGTSTAANGAFRLENLLLSDVLVVSYIGYKKTEVAVKDEAAGSIILEEATNELDEVVAQGYSKTTHRLSTTSVSKVTSEEIARQPVMNPLMALQGKVPGMVLTPVSGYAASPVTIDIRGRGTINGNSGSPLIIIDGTPMNVSANNGTGNLYNPLAGAIGNGPIQGRLIASLSPANGQSPLFGLNPRDIESIEVLKDVGATAIYGSNGADGVILITTKRGKAGGSNIDVDVNYGISTITKYWDLLNTQQYLEMRREAFKNDGIIPTPTNAPDLFIWDTTRYTNWQKELWGKTAGTLNATVGFSGGTPQFTHRISANYNNRKDITGFGKNEVMGLSASLEQRSANQKFRIALNAQYSYAFSKMVTSPNIFDLPPNAPALFDETGSLNFKEWNEAGAGQTLESFGIMLRPFISRVYNLSSNLTISYQLMKGLGLSASLGYNTNNAEAQTKQPIASYNPSTFPSGTAVFNNSKNNSLNIEPKLSYDSWLFGKGKLNIVTGATIKQEKRQSLESLGMGYSNDALLGAIEFAGFAMTSNTSQPYKYAGIFGRMGYVWDNKYIIDINARRDGSSRFGAGSRFGNFGSVGLGWVISDESWAKKIMTPVVDYLKVYVNTGTSGRDGGKDYQFLTQWGKTTVAYNYDEVVPLTSLHAVNQQFHWELQKELNIGMTGRLLKNGAIGFEVNYYRRRSTDQLTDNPTPEYTGFKSVYGNWAATVQNEGWEFRLNATPVRSKNFSWTASFNSSFSRSLLLSYPGIEKSIFHNILLVGQPTTMQYLLEYIGVDPLTGAYQFRDHNKDGIIHADAVTPLTPISDRRRQFNFMPKFSGGMFHNISYKNLMLSIGMDFKIQKGKNALQTVQQPGSMSNIPLDLFKNRWQKAGDMARYEKLSTGQVTNVTYTGNSTLYYTDASFFRFTNIAVAYSFPEQWIKRLNLKGGSFNINAQNLFTISKYVGLDPEMQNFGGMPPTRVITAGISLTL